MYGLLARLVVTVSLLVLAGALVSTCEGDIGGSGAPALTEDGLRNAEYQGIYEVPVELSDGLYEGEPFVEGSASRPTVAFLEPYAWGDLDGDGADDAAVLLAEDSGGSGTFVYLAAVANREGRPVNVASTLLADRCQVQSIAIEANRIFLQALTHGPEDPLCCPSQDSPLIYELLGGELIRRP